jgi:hypothetical protein
MKGPELGANSVAGRTIKGEEHGITSLLLSRKRRV